MLEAAGRGLFPNPDGTVEVLPPPPGRAMAVVAFTGHYLIATAAPEAWIRHRLREDDRGAAMSPHFLSALGDKLNLRDGGVDVLLAATALVGAPALREADALEHSQATKATALRENVRVFTDRTGAATLVLGQGLAYRTEVAIRVEPAQRCRGVATNALTEARRLATPGQILFAQVAPGNAAFLSAGASQHLDESERGRIVRL